MRPWCRACSVKESTSRCCYHGINLCASCAEDHNDRSVCYWAAVGVAELVDPTRKKQMEIEFKKEEE